MNSNKINEILSEWDPIEIGKPLSLYEYQQYVPDLISIGKHKEKLYKQLLLILNRLGIEFNPNKKEFSEDIGKIVDDLYDNL